MYELCKENICLKIIIIQNSYIYNMYTAGFHIDIRTL